MRMTNDDEKVDIGDCNFDTEMALALDPLKPYM